MLLSMYIAQSTSNEEWSNTYVQGYSIENIQEKSGRNINIFEKMQLSLLGEEWTVEGFAVRH